MEIHWTEELPLDDADGNPTGESREVDCYAEVDYTPGRTPPAFYRDHDDPRFGDPGESPELDVLEVWRIVDGEREDLPDDHADKSMLYDLAYEACAGEEQDAAEARSEARAEARADREREGDWDD